jgi:hypothetical protein
MGKWEKVGGNGIGGKSSRVTTFQKWIYGVAGYLTIFFSRDPLQ